MLLVRPYPVHRLDHVRQAIAAAAAGDVRPLQALYGAAVDALAALDPDEVDEFRDAHPQLAATDRALAKAALEVADTWEGVVSLGALLTDPRRFRGFAWLVAQANYIDGGRLDVGALAAGAELADTSPEDAALFAALPALVGLGPELPDELPEPCPLDGTRVSELLGLPDGDWDGIDPLDGVAVSAETCRARFAALPPAWRDVVGRGLQTGLLVRPADD